MFFKCLGLANKMQAYHSKFIIHHPLIYSIAPVIQKYCFLLNPSIPFIIHFHTCCYFDLFTLLWATYKHLELKDTAKFLLGHHARIVVMQIYFFLCSSMSSKHVIHWTLIAVLYFMSFFRKEPFIIYIFILSSLLSSCYKYIIFLPKKWKPNPT